MSLIMTRFTRAHGVWKNPAKICASIHFLSTRAAEGSNSNKSSYDRHGSGPIPGFEPVRQVFISQSNDIFSNLALEDWLYQHHDFDHKHLLLLWRNDPCVVIGRHQNPWTETNVPYIRNSYVNLARRNSGGGTVFHDLGNINCTFFTRKSEYRRVNNLEIICSAIRRLSNLDVRVNGREDIVLDNTHKISGTAAKLGKDNAYHHCTILVDVNQCHLHDALDSHAENIETRATQSVRVPVKNLKEVVPYMTAEMLLEAIGCEFLRTNCKGIDVGPEKVREQRGFSMIRPEEEWFAGLDKLRENLKSNEWIFGKTPLFKVSKSFKLPKSLTGSDDKTKQKFEVELTVNRGMISDVRIIHPIDFLSSNLATIFHGLKFNQNLQEQFVKVINVKIPNESFSEQKKQFLVKCIEGMVEKIA